MRTPDQKWRSGARKSVHVRALPSPRWASRGVRLGAGHAAPEGGVSVLHSFPFGQSVEINAASRVVVVRYQGRSMTGTREPTPENCAQAEEQGYTPDADGCWRSLVDHELLHPFLASWAFGEPSFVVRHEAGAESVPYATRLFEEGIVIAFQRFANSGEVTLPLRHFERATLASLAIRFRREYTRRLAA